MSDDPSQKILSDLKKLRNDKNLVGMSKFGISTQNALGISVTHLRKIAKSMKRDHDIAIKLWDSKIHEARILATMIAEPEKVTQKLMIKWASDFNSWDLCDQCCNNLFRKTPFAIDYSLKWPEDNKLFIKRAGFVLMAVLAVHNKKMSDEDFKKYFPIIREHSIDERNFVKKSVNWALRQIGKRNRNLHSIAKALALDLTNSESKASKWVGRNAINELNSERVLNSFSESS